MAGKISDLVEIITPATGDFLEILDVSDGTPGTNKKITQDNLLSTAVLLTGDQSISGTKTFDLIEITSGDTSANGINFGDDVNLYRVGVNNLITDDNFTAVSLTTTTGENALSIASTGQILFSSDTNLYRLAADTLKTDDNLIIAGTVSSGAGNAVTVDGTQNLTNKTLISPVFQGTVSGYITATQTLTYASSTTVTISGDVTAIYTPGTKVKFTQTTPKYFVVASSSYSATNTTLTFITNTTYTVANAAISSVFYSYGNPEDWPTHFAYTPTFSGFSSQPTNFFCMWNTIGRRIFFDIRMASTGTSNATTFSLTSPVTASGLTSSSYRTVAAAFDNGVSLTTPSLVIIFPGSSTIDVYKDFSGGSSAWTNANGKLATFSINFTF